VVIDGCNLRIDAGPCQGIAMNCRICDLGSAPAGQAAGQKSAELPGTESMVPRRGREGWRIVHIHWSSHAVAKDAN